MSIDKVEGEDPAETEDAGQDAEEVEAGVKDFARSRWAEETGMVDYEDLVRAPGRHATRRDRAEPAVEREPGDRGDDLKLAVGSEMLEALANEDAEDWLCGIRENRAE